MRLLSFVIVCACLLPSAAGAQDQDVWTLQRCVQYAVDHNISIQQNVLNERLAALALKQSKLSQLPSANVSTGYGRSYGRSVDPTSNQFIDANYNFLSLNGSADVLLFGWFQRRNTIAKNDLSYKASVADVDQLKDDVSLNVATGFLRALLAKGQIGVNEKQVALSEQQLDQTRRFAEAGRLPELNVAQLTSQLATDSSNLIGAISDYTSALLDLRALLNLDFTVPFDIQEPAIDVTDIASILANKPEDVYRVAANHFGGIRSSKLKVAAAEKAAKASEGLRYPQLTFDAQLGSNYASTYTQIDNYTQTGISTTASGYYYDNTGKQVPIYQPTFSYSTSTIPINNQIGNNLRQTYSLNLSIPLFGAWQAQAAVRQSRINVQAQQLAEDQVEITLKQNVYKACNDARNSTQKYYAAQRAAVAAREAYGFAQKRYDLGLTNTVDYLVTQNNQYRADASELSAKYDLIFRLQVINYYLGRQLKL